EESLSTSTKNGTSTKFGTGTKNGTCTSTKFGTGTSTKFGTGNLPIEPTIESLKKTSKKRFDLHVFQEGINPHSIPKELIDEWKKNRKSQRAPITDLVWNRVNKVMTELAEKGISPVD